MEISKNTEIENKTAGLGTHASGTLWDNEKAQDSLRLIVENAKVNIIIALLKDLKVVARSPNYLDLIAGLGNRIGKSVEEVSEKTAHFEFDAGLILKRLFEHVEAVQTADLNLLLEHLLACINGVLESRVIPDHIELRQEGLVFHYLFSLFHFIEHLNQGQIVNWCISNNITQKLIEILLLRLELFPDQIRQKLLETLGSIADNVISIQENLLDSQFLPDAETKQKLVLLRKNVIRDLIVEFPERRPVIRPFLEVIDRFERELKFPKKK
jgi:hypothetical protein